MSQPMMWVFAVLIVLAMGGVAMLAAGRGEPMAPAYDDRPDALVPEAAPIAADDLRRVRFSLAFRGYRMAEVDALLARLAAELDAARALPYDATPVVDPRTLPPSVPPSVPSSVPPSLPGSVPGAPEGPAEGGAGAGDGLGQDEESAGRHAR